MGQEETSDRKENLGKMNSLDVSLKLDPKIGNICYKSINIEVKNNALRRSRVEISFKNDTLGLHIEAKDLIALRAALNTYLGWIKMCYDLLS